MVNGRDKGRRGELEIAHTLQLWWRKVEPAALFIRTPLSGGWSHNTKAAAHFKASGDVMTTAAQFPFCVEVKWREGWDPDRLLDCKPTACWAWWIQCQVAATKQGEVPCMFMRRNRVKRSGKPFPWLVWLPASYVENRRLSNPDVRWPERTLDLNGIDYGEILPVAYVLDRFLEMAPERMRADGTDLRAAFLPSRQAGAKRLHQGAKT